VWAQKQAKMPRLCGRQGVHVGRNCKSLFAQDELALPCALGANRRADATACGVSDNAVSNSLSFNFAYTGALLEPHSARHHFAHNQFADPQPGSGAYRVPYRVPYQVAHNTFSKSEPGDTTPNVCVSDFCPVGVPLACTYVAHRYDVHQGRAVVRRRRVLHCAETGLRSMGTRSPRPKKGAQR
jgi:hypothetical protein